MPFFLTLVVFVALALAVALAGMKLYVRPKEAMERVVGGIEPDRADARASQPGDARSDQEAGQLHSAVAQRRDGDAAAADPRRHPQ